MHIGEFEMTNQRIERFWSRVVKTETCWIWTGAKSKGSNGGYGHLGIGKGSKKTVSAHKLSMLLTGVEIPAGMCVCHRCDVNLCVRPDHLFLGTSADNAKDCTDKGRRAYGEAHKASKLTDEKVRFIRSEYAAGKTQQQIADLVGVHQGNVGRVLQGKIWKHVI